MERRSRIGSVASIWKGRIRVSFIISPKGTLNISCSVQMSGSPVSFLSFFARCFKMTGANVSGIVALNRAITPAKIMLTYHYVSVKSIVLE